MAIYFIIIEEGYRHLVLLCQETVDSRDAGFHVIDLL